MAKTDTARPSKQVGAYEYFDVFKNSPRRGRKTSTYDIISKRGHVLGSIRWYSSWRKFCFFPDAPGTVWSSGCLEDVTDVLVIINEEYKRPNETPEVSVVCDSP